MKVIRANCRIQFTPQDIAFLLNTLDQHSKQETALQNLLADPDSRTLLLDSDTIYEAIIDTPANLPISIHLYFYVLVRRVLRNAGIENEELADYVAELLAEFTRSESPTNQTGNSNTKSLSLDAWIETLRGGNHRVRFEQKAHVANRLLFHTGIHEEWLRHRTERRGAPTLEFYESVGPMFYRDAGQHSLAKSYDLRLIFEQLSGRFHETRVALNELATRLLHFDSPSYPLVPSEITNPQEAQEPEAPPGCV